MKIFIIFCSCFGTTYSKIGTIQRRLAWPLRKDDTQIREAFLIFLPLIRSILYRSNYRISSALTPKSTKYNKYFLFIITLHYTNRLL